MDEPAPPRRSLGRSLREASKALGCLAVPLGLALLAAIPCCGPGHFGLRKSDLARRDLNALETSVREYVRRTGEPPKKLRALVDAGLLESEPLDPWGNPYQLSVPRKGLGELSSLGEDGEPGGEGSDEDILHRFRLDSPPP
jgi:hypothetical protein